MRVFVESSDGLATCKDGLGQEAAMAREVLRSFEEDFVGDLRFSYDSALRRCHPRPGTFQGMPRSSRWPAACSSPAASVV